MRLTVNGESREVEPGTTIAGLVGLLGADSRRVAVAVNGTVIPRASHPDRVLAEGDEIEVIEPVGGG